MADAKFEVPRLAEIYDAVDDDRSDLDVYLALADELAAHSVLDVGCGTGTFACMLAAEGMEVTAIDPASIARGRASKAVRGQGPLDPDGGEEAATVMVASMSASASTRVALAISWSTAVWR